MPPAADREDIIHTVSRRANPIRLITPANTPFFGAAVFLLGAAGVIGLLFQIPFLTSIRPHWSPMSLNTAFCFLLAGSALMLQVSVHGKALVRSRTVLGALVFLIAAVVMLQIVTGSAWIDFTTWQKDAYPNIRRPGQMAPNTALCMMLAGAALVLSERLRNRHALRMLRGLNSVLLLVGFVSAASYVINLEFLYSWAEMKRMAFHTAIGLIVLGLGIWTIWHEASVSQRQEEGTDVRHIYLASDLILIMIVVVVALAGFALAQDQAEKLMAEQMRQTAQERRIFVDLDLRLRNEQAAQISTRPNLIAIVREIKKTLGPVGISDRLNASAASFLQHDISALAYTDENGRVIGSAGSFVGDYEINLPISGKYPADLRWKDGYILHTRLPMKDKLGLVGYVVVEQHLKALTGMHAEAIRQGETGDMVICGLRGTDQICFPFRWKQKPAVVPGYLDGAPLPITRAVKGEVSTDITLDFRRQRVMVALGPIGKTGLGMAVKMDMWELYEPIRRQFLQSIPFFILLVAGSVWLMRVRLRPLVRALDNSRQELAFIARHDSLTGLPNRALFLDRLTQAMIRARRSKRTMGLMYLDIDHFKTINDSFGHLVGDDLLRWLSTLLRENVRESDTVARLGGDEFTIILEGLADHASAERIADNILKAVERSDPPLPDNRTVRPSVSIGIAFYEGEMLYQEDLLGEVDAALYRAKQRGRNTYVKADDPVNEQEAATIQPSE